MPCGVEGCPATPSSYEGLRQHMYRKHRSLLTGSTTDTASSIPATDYEDLPQDNELEDEAEPACVEQPNSTVLGAQFILKTRDGQKLTQVATNGIIKNTNTILQSTIELIQKRVFETFGEEEIQLTDQQREKIEDIFVDDALVNPFRGLETEYTQEKFIKENFNYVVSVIVHTHTL